MNKKAEAMKIQLKKLYKTKRVEVSDTSHRINISIQDVINVIEEKASVYYNYTLGISSKSSINKWEHRMDGCIAARCEILEKLLGIDRDIAILPPRDMCTEKSKSIEEMLQLTYYKNNGIAC